MVARKAVVKRFVWQRALRRMIRRVFTQEALYSGNRESFQQSFMSRDSILLWVMQAYSLRRREYRKVYDEDRFSEVEKIEFKQPGARPSATSTTYSNS